MAVLVAGCSGGGSTAPPVATTAPAATSAATSAPATTAAGATPAGPTRTPASGGDATGGGTGSVPNCATSELSGSLGNSEGAAGSVYVSLILTNTGSRTCELRGFPGVSYVAGDDGHQVGPAAEMSGARGGEVPMKPGATAVAQLQMVQVANFDAAVCKPTPTRGLRVYPPGDTQSLFIETNGTGCAGTPPGPQLSVQTLKAP